MEHDKRLIDANALRKKAIWGKIRQGTVYESDAKVVTTGSIDTAPTVDAVEVVRCKDCAVPHNRWTGCPKLNGLVTPPDFYCGCGERKDHEIQSSN